MLWNVYRFNYNSDLQILEFPSNDPIPEDLSKIILAYRFVIEQDAFDLLRVSYGSQKLIIQKYIQPALCYQGVCYYWTARLSQND